MENILNFIKINDNLYSSGQPKVEEFKEIKNLGIEVVINLALCDASNAINNEDRVVTDLNMAYFHIPVDFENPLVSQASIFLNTLKVLINKKVWVHCALNYRATVFLYLYHKHILNTPFNEINLKVFDAWRPDENWQKIMKLDFNELDI